MTGAAPDVMTIEADWLRAAPTRAVMAALEAGRPGGPAQAGPAARFVGGCVRNALLGQPAGDIDIATSLTPDQTLRALQAAHIKAVPTGLEHGTVTAVAHGAPFEITTLRRDVRTDGRRALVAFGADWLEDAQRRDFRLNAIYADAGGVLLDPVGGVADAKARRVVFIGAPDDRIKEDYLRILRFFRFSAWYAGGALDAAGLAACARLAPGMAALSAERIWKELKKLLAAADPRAALQAMEQSGVLAQTLPESHGAAMLERLIGAQAAADAHQDGPADPMPRFMALMLEQNAARAAAARLKMSNDEKDRLAAGLSRDGGVIPPLSERAARAAIYRMGRRAFLDRLALSLANGAGGAGDLARYRAMRSFAQDWTPPRLPISGDDVARSGVGAGPQIGAVLRALEQWWIDNDFPSDRKTLLARVQSIVQSQQ